MTRKAVVVIADDEPLARRALRGHLGTLDWLGEVHEVGDGLAAIRAVDTLRPHILFLDIVMPGVTGLAVVEQIKHRPYIVFTTAFERYAVTAFEIGALDFLLKPFGRERVRAAAERGRSAIEHGMPPVVARAHEALATSRPIQRVFVRERGRVVVPIEDHDLAGSADPEGEAGASEMERKLREGLGHLPRLQREVFLMRAQQGMAYDDICAALGTTPGAARVHYHHAVKRLKEMMQ